MGFRSLLPPAVTASVLLLLPSCDTSSFDAAAQAARDAVRAAARASAEPSNGSPRRIATTAPVKAACDEVIQGRAWFERSLIGGYRRVGRRSPKWDAAAETFIRESAPAFMGLTLAASPDLVAKGHDLVQAGCDDPVVLYFAARATSMQDADSREASELFERAVAGIHDVAYPRAVARFIASGLRADYDRREEGTGKRAALEPVELNWFLESLKDASYTPDEDVVLMFHMTQGTGYFFFKRNRAAVVTALEGAPWVDPWVRHLFSGMRQVLDAWDARGNAFAGKVKPEGWKGFEESLAGARGSLTESWRLRPDRPEAAAELITVAMADRTGDSPRLWFDRAAAARLDYLPAYMHLINGLRTRWSGDPDALLSFARECAETRRFDTDVPLMAFRAVEQMEADRVEEARGEDATDEPPRPLPPSVYRDDAVYRLVATVLERYRRDPSTGVRWQWWASLDAAVAYKAGHYAEARQALEDVGGKLEGEAYDTANEPQLEARIEAFASPDGGQIRRAEDLYRAFHADQALPLFRQARQRAKATAAPYLDERLAAGTLETDLRAGRTVGFLPGVGLAGWTPRIGKWSVDADGSLLGTSAAKGTLIVADARIGPDFEIEADIEIVSTSNGQFQAGIVFGPEPSFWTQRWSSFRIKKTSHEGEVAYFSSHFNRPVRIVKHPVGLRSHVVIQSWDGRLWAYLDGEPVAADYAPEWKMPRAPDAQVGFGAYLDDNTMTLRYRNVRLRQLTARPLPPPSPVPLRRP